MRNPFLLAILLVITISAAGQTTVSHYVKFFHVGQKVLPVYTLNVCYEQGDIPRDSIEATLDTLKPKTIVTDKATYDALADYVKNAHFHLSKKDAGILNFGTFRITQDGQHYYVPDKSCTDYFKNMITYLRKKKGDKDTIQGIIDNYQWIFNP